MAGILGNMNAVQYCVISKDVEATKRAYARFFGVEVPPTQDAGTYEITRTEYYGKPNEKAGCLQAFFQTGDIQFEIIQPNDAQSTWRDYLEKHGEGLHHIAYKVEDIFKAMDDMKAAGYELTQWGYYGDASGAYAYFDCTEDLKCYIELLCDFKKD